MTKKKVRSSHAGSSQKVARRSRSRSPLPDSIDVFAPLSSMISDHERLAATAVIFVGWSDVIRMLPPYLQLHFCNLAVIWSSTTLARSLTTVQCFISQMKNDIVGQTVIFPQIPPNFMETFLHRNYSDPQLRISCKPALPELQRIASLPLFWSGLGPGPILSCSPWVKVPHPGTIKSDGGLAHVSGYLTYADKGRSRDDVVLLVSDELDGMSKKRILRVLQGEDDLSSSSSSEVSEEDEDVGSERLSNQSSHSGDRSTEASAHSDGESTSSSERSDVDGSESERASFSDIELIEGLDVDSNNLPDVSGT
ncbi:hypothetical protein Y032_0006g2918 [Ancylostoma ceylanicum]|uniref:Uncharacterized protein n=1 Tax=Ancylostoma ceylanicum TaxID=53326 RepID=A0A016VP06_9BILA|nr:hypothetical protein Y032_0006g2918 [Ancylostoma ceylanicum]